MQLADLESFLCAFVALCLLGGVGGIFFFAVASAADGILLINFLKFLFLNPFPVGREVAFVEFRVVVGVLLRGRKLDVHFK